MTANPDCDHVDPAAWVHENGKAYCRGCGRFMGRVVTEAPPAETTEAFRPASGLFDSMVGPTARRVGGKRKGQA